MLSFLRKKLKNVEAPHETPEPAPPVAPPTVATPDEPSRPVGEEAAKPKRRRGSRGGRGRRKPAGETAAAAAPAKPKPPVEKPDRPAKPERRPDSGDRRSTGKQRSSRRRIEPRRAPLPAAKRELLVSVDVSEQRVAVFEDERVAEVYLERPERRSIAGNIYLGTVDNVLPGMEAAFVEIGLEKNGFLYVDEIVVPELEGKRHGKRIQDLLSRNQTLLVQAVKDPMKTKGARLTTEISLPGRFVVFVPNGEGLGVSRRLPDEERIRLRDVLKALDVPSGGVIVRTAAEGASAEDIERDLVFLQRLWKTVTARAAELSAPALVYQEAELPLRVVRDLFTGDFERALIDHELTFKRVVGYLKKTSPHMVERVVRHRDRTPLFESFGVDAELRSTLSRRVDLPSGGYLVFDYAEAFTVIDVNTGRFVGSRSKNSGARLEDTITKNNLEAVKEVVRQLRLRDIGGIIVIDFIDMASPKNRAVVEEALKQELERDRTKTYVVEISPLGLVEMTRQNVTDGPREILTRKCPTCAGDGVILSEASAAVEAERKLRALAPGARTQAFRVELHPRVASILVGPGARRLAEIEAQTKRRFFIETAAGAPLEHFRLLDSGKLEALQPSAPVTEGDEVELKLVEVGLHDPAAAVGKVTGYDISVGHAARLVGKKVRVRIDRVFEGSAYATWLDAPPPAATPITAESEAEKPTRQPRARKLAAEAATDVVPVDDEADELDELDEPDALGEAAPVDETAEAPGETGEEAPKKRTRRGNRGGRGRKRKVEAVSENGQAIEADDGATAAEPVDAGEPVGEEAELVEAGVPPEAAAAGPRIHLPSDQLGRDDDATDGDAPEGEGAPAKKRTRRGTRGGRGRRKTATEATTSADGEAVGALAVADPSSTETGEASRDGEAETAAATLEPAAQSASATRANGDGEASGWDYVPMAEWDDHVEAVRPTDEESS
ncbi:MAG: Rne/Rng family ribonuclease [Actinobacteria bacterium]|nr:Rne/Rng family ribonuclease [Actinomycetota bacterium]